MYATDLLGPIELVTAPTGQVVTAARVRRQAYIDLTIDDDIIDEQIAAATDWCQEEISGHRQMLLASYDLPIRSWWSGELELPRPPLSSLTSVKYYDTDGTLTTLASTYYAIRRPWQQPGTVEIAARQFWPAVESSRSYPIVLRFVAGYGAPAAVPAKLKQAVLMLAAYWYDTRTPVDAMTKEVPFGVTSLILQAGWGSYR